MTAPHTTITPRARRALHMLEVHWENFARRMETGGPVSDILDNIAAWKVEAHKHGATEDQIEGVRTKVINATP